MVRAASVGARRRRPAHNNALYSAPFGLAAWASAARFNGFVANLVLSVNASVRGREEARRRAG